MSRPKRPSEPRHDKAGAIAADEGGTPMERFKKLAKRVLSVSNVAVQKERRCADGSRKK